MVTSHMLKMPMWCFHVLSCASCIWRYWAIRRRAGERRLPTQKVQAAQACTSMQLLKQCHQRSLPDDAKEPLGRGMKA